VYVAAVVLSWPPRAGETKRQQALYLAGVARGDVARVVVGDQTLYTRGKTWGEFGGASLNPARVPARCSSTGTGACSSRSRSP
jgi:hypothetical protein